MNAKRQQGSAMLMVLMLAAALAVILAAALRCVAGEFRDNRRALAEVGRAAAELRLAPAETGHE